MTRTIDVHNHLYPRQWIDYLETRTTSPTMKWTGPTSIVFYSGEVIVAHVDRAGHYDPQARIEDLVGRPQQGVAMIKEFWSSPPHLPSSLI
jgi:aminocarboxymuconate-semialdehyde decarboxylase